MIPEKVAEAFAFQGKACSDLGSPFMGQLMGLCATRDWPDGAIKTRIFNWPGAIGPRDQSVPLRLAGALHAAFLKGDEALTAVYPPHQVSDDTLWDAVCAALVAQADFIDSWIDSPPQTNEVRRSIALISVGHWLADHYGLPIHTSELGASGGLNLHWDRYGMLAQGQVFGAAKPALTLKPDWSGPLPPDATAQVVSRAGIDLNPLDPGNPAEALRLQAYLWPDQPERMALTRAAMAATTTKVAQGDAVDWLASRLNHIDGQLHLIYSTIAWQYFPTEKQKLGERLIADAGKSATDQAPLAWFSMENDGGARGAALTLRLWPGDRIIWLGRADFHGRWIDWTGGLPS